MDRPVTDATARDREDPLAEFTAEFVDAGLYMDGNSLGLVSSRAEDSLRRVFEEWRRMAIDGWTDGQVPWFEFAESLRDDLGTLVGAAPAEVIVANTTTTNIHALVQTFFEEGDILVNELDFPSDHYALRAQLRTRGLDPESHLRVVPSRDGRTIELADVEAALDEDIELVFFPSVLYRSGQQFDLTALTELAHEYGALAGFDLAHSVGVVDHDLDAAGVDFAVWCHYKYVNAGPGAPGGLYVNERHFDTRPALPGWWGHEKETQFEMNMTFTPASGAGAYQIGTPPLLSLAPLEGALEVLLDAGIEAVAAKSTALTEYLITLLEESAIDCTVGTPRAPAARGGHVAVEYPQARAVSRALRDRGVITDFRPPNVVRVCPAPLYTSFEDVYRVVEAIETIIETEAYAAYTDANSQVP